MATRSDPEVRGVALAVGCTAIAATALATVASLDALTTLGVVAIVVLGGFAAVATMFDVDIQTRVGLSGNAMFLIATLVVFREVRLYMGVAIVALLGAIDYAQLRRREYYKVAINAGNDCLALLAGALVCWSVAPGKDP